MSRYQKFPPAGPRWRFVFVIACVLLVLIIIGRAYAGPPPAIGRAVCATFKGRCAEALAVAWCESRYDVNARNGQYLGLFQMGSWERRTFGHGPDALAQARAAYRYFIASGSDWSPWSCRP